MAAPSTSARRDRAGSAAIPALTLALAISACGGDKGTGPTPPPPPPPAPVVTTIEVAPGSPSIEAGDSVRLAATVKDQNGAVMTGKTVSWSSGSQSVATVATSGLVTGVSAGQATITAAVDGKQGNATVTVTEQPVVLEAGSSTTATIGTAGGSLSATANGETWSLAVPPGALTGKMQITMTPVRSLRGLPAGGEFVTGVKFEPSGLVFREPATLRVVHHVTPAAGKTLIGYLADDAGALQALAPATRKGDTLTLAVPHFTIAGWGQFTHSQLTVIIPTLPSNAGAQGLLNQLVALPMDSPIGPVRAILEQWYGTMVQPELANVTGNTTTQNIQAAIDFRLWDRYVTGSDAIFNFGGTLIAALQPTRQQGIGLLRPVLTLAIGLSVADCPTATPLLRPISIAEEVFVLQDIAKEYGLATAANGLDAPSVVALLDQCTQVVNTLASYPANPTPNVTAQLDLRYGLLVGASPAALPDIPFKVTLTLTGSTTDGTQVTQTDLTGFITGPVTPTGQAALVADLVACIHPIMGYRLDEICTRHQVTRSFGVTINGSLSIASQVGLQQSNNVAKITGNLVIQSTPGNPITSTDLRELAQLSEVGGNVIIAGLPGLTSLAGLQGLAKIGGSLSVLGNPVLATLTGLGHLTTAGSIVVADNPALGSLDGLQGITALTDLQVARSPLLPNLGGLLNLRQVATLTLSELPLVQSLQSLRAVQVTGGFTIGKMAGLTTLAGLNAVAPVLTGSVFVTGNPLLTDLAALAGVTSARSIAITENPVLPDVDELASLTTTAQGLTINGAGLTSVAGLSGLRSGSLDLELWLMPLVTNVSLPALTDGGSIVIENLDLACQGGRHITVSAPSLTRATGFRASAGSAAGGCTMSVSVPALSSGGTLNIGGAVTSVSLPGSFTGGGFVVVGTKLATLQVPSLTVDDLTIGSNPNLTAVGGGGGRIRRRVAIQSNAKLSTQAVTTWIDGFDHTGAQILISGNKTP